MNIEVLRNTLLREDFASQPEPSRIIILNSAPDVPYDLYFKVVMAIDQADGILALLEEEEETP